MGIRRTHLAAALSLAVSLLVPPHVHAAQGKARFVDIPKGWRTSIQRPAPGVEVIRMAREGQRVSVAAISPAAPVRIEHVLARNRLAGKGRRTQPTTKICRRDNCLVGINAAFFDRSNGLPYSGIVSNGELIRSVTSSRPHVALDSGLQFNQTTPQVELVMTEPDLFSGGSGFEEREHRFSLKGVNRGRGSDGIVVYTRHWATTSPATSGRELVLRGQFDPRLPIGSRKSFEIVHNRVGGGPIPHDGVVISGSGDGARSLSNIWKRVSQGTLRSVVELEIAPGPGLLVGTRPLILRANRVIEDRSYFGRMRQPRSILASKPDGTILFVVIDGRAKNRRGMSLQQAGWFVRSLGASDATNLDGGGSSALALNGRLHSQPPGSERSVSTALLVLRN